MGRGKKVSRKGEAVIFCDEGASCGEEGKLGRGFVTKEGKMGKGRKRGIEKGGVFNFQVG